VSVFASILILALTRSELLERMRAPVLIRAEGLVRVYADCPEDMRREYQSVIAGYASDTVNRLYLAQGIAAKKFRSPGIAVYVGDVRTNNPEVVVRQRERDDGGRMTRIYLMAPGYADLDRFRIELVKAFFLAVKGETIDDDRAVREFRATDPKLRVMDLYAELSDWLAGRPVDGDDEKYLKLMRSVLIPGKATMRDVLIFSSRLFLYPEFHSHPFCGRYRVLSFRDAVKVARDDAEVRSAARRKASQIIAFGGGRGEKLHEAAAAYAAFLLAFSEGVAEKEQLKEMLDDADVKLNVAFEAAKKMEEGK
jgi:hypothetical protein